MQSNQGQGRRKGSSKQKDSRPSVKEKGLEETSGFLGVSYIKMTQKKKHSFRRWSVPEDLDGLGGSYHSSSNTSGYILGLKRELIHKPIVMSEIKSFGETGSHCRDLRPGLM